MTLPAGTQGRCQVYMQGLGYAWKNLQVYQVWCHCSYDVAASFRMCLPYNYRKMTLLYPNHSSVLPFRAGKISAAQGVFVDTNQYWHHKQSHNTFLECFPQFCLPCSVVSAHLDGGGGASTTRASVNISPHLCLPSRPYLAAGASASERRVQRSTSRFSIYDSFCISH